MPYNEYKSLNLPDIDREVRSFWENNDIFNKSIAERADGQPFVFYEGPPSANGLPGIHHVMARAIKDLFCRYHTMKGERVERKGGWDTHGLPIELSVEKELGITKEDIGKKYQSTIITTLVARRYCAIKISGTNSRVVSAIGSTWSIHTSRTKMIISSQSGICCRFYTKRSVVQRIYDTTFLACCGHWLEFA